MIMGDNNIPKELKDEYYTKAFIEIKKYLNEEYDKILKKLNIIIEDRPYTHYDFALINAENNRFGTYPNTFYLQLHFRGNKRDYLINLCDEVIIGN